MEIEMEIPDCDIIATKKSSLFGSFISSLQTVFNFVWYLFSLLLFFSLAIVSHTR